jgi:hypothetical protein
VRAAQRSKILDGHRSVGYARQRALSTCRNSLPRGAPFYNAFYMEQQLDAPLDAKFIRLAVRDLRTGKTGAMEIPLPLAPEK